MTTTNPPVKTKANELMKRQQEYLTPKDQLEVPSNLNYKSFYDMVLGIDHSKAVNLVYIVGHSNPADLYLLNEHLTEGAILFQFEGGLVTIERVGKWISNGIGFLEELLSHYGVDSIKKLRTQEGEQVEEALYGLKAENQGVICLPEPHFEKTLFVPSKFLPEEVPLRLWMNGELMSGFTYLLREQSLCAEVNQIYEEVHKEYQVRGDKITVELISPKDKLPEVTHWENRFKL